MQCTLRWDTSTAATMAGGPQIQTLRNLLAVKTNLLCDSGLDHNLTLWLKVELLLIFLLPPKITTFFPVCFSPAVPFFSFLLFSIPFSRFVILPSSFFLRTYLGTC